MKIFASLALLAAALTASGLQAADEGRWMLTMGAVRLTPTNKSDAFTALDTYYLGNVLQTSHATAPEVALGFAFTKYFRAEVSMVQPQSQTLTLVNSGDLGTFKETLTSLLLQWHFNPGGVVNPYVGIGSNVTRFSSSGLSFAGNSLSLGAKSVGTAFQAGLDIGLGEHWHAKVEAKSVQADADLNVAGAKLAGITMNPMLYGVGVGYSF